MNDLTLIEESEKYLQNISPQYSVMVKDIKKYMPVINKGLSNFGKTQSQFMDNMLTVSKLTPLRNLSQILAEINRTLSALREAILENKERETRIKILKQKIENTDDELQKELFQVKIDKFRNNIHSSEYYIGGAIKKVKNYKDQYQSIMKTHGYESFDEIDFEKEEERYHIMRAFDQAITAARSRGGMIDEGNQIYLNQIGINGLAAQIELKKYFIEESKCLKENKLPTHTMLREFLEKMADKFQGSANSFAQYKGMNTLINEGAALKNE